MTDKNPFIVPLQCISGLTTMKVDIHNVVNIETTNTSGRWNPRVYPDNQPTLMITSSSEYGDVLMKYYYDNLDALEQDRRELVFRVNVMNFVTDEFKRQQEIQR